MIIIERDLFGLLNVLDFEGGNILFQQRETNEPRTSFQMEQEALSFVAAGKPDEMVAHYKDIFLSDPKIKISVGKLSRDEIRHLKYMAVSAIAIVCRVAIQNGVAEAVAYSMSDDAIQKIDKMIRPESILLLLIKMVYRYTELVGESKAAASLSRSVRDAVEYIVAHLHSKISLDDLIQKCSYNKEYFSKLFKKEVGVSITDYILDLRIQEAKKLLQEGKSSREIAYLLQFSSQSYFIQQFKKVSGITPKEYKMLHY